MNKLTFFTGLGMIGMEVLGVLGFLLVQTVELTPEFITKSLALGILVLFNIIGVILMILGAIKD